MTKLLRKELKNYVFQKVKKQKVSTLMSTATIIILSISFFSSSSTGERKISIKITNKIKIKYP